MKWIPLALAISPSSWAILCIAVGAMPMGMVLSNPNTFVDVDLWDTSRRCLGRILNLQQHFIRPNLLCDRYNIDTFERQFYSVAM